MREPSNKRRWVAVIASLCVFAASLTVQGATKLASDLSQDKASQVAENLLQPTLTEKVVEGDNPQGKILEIPITGVIAKGGTSNPLSSGDGYDHQLILDSLKKAQEDPSIKGLLLTVDSPGGGVFESAEVYKAIMDLKAKTHLPVYTSMQRMAASGGYYIASASDKIFASQETLTGSIGVIMHSLNVSGLLEKYGVKDATIKSAAHKDIMSTTRPMTDEEKKILQGYVDSAYQRFVNVVDAGRKNLDRDQVLKLADGRIYDGQQAKDNGLVDVIGYRQDAIKALAKELRIKNPEVVTYKTDAFSSWTKWLPKSLSPKGPNSWLTRFFVPAESRTDDLPRAMYLFGGE